jgi:hypothetical protein
VFRSRNEPLGPPHASPNCPGIILRHQQPLPRPRSSSLTGDQHQQKGIPAVTDQSAAVTNDVEFTAEVADALENWPTNTANPRRIQI